MGLWQRIFGREPERRSAPTSWDLLAGRGIDSEAGVAVSAHVAENLSAAFASVQLIASTLASLSVIVYRVDRSTGARFENPQHPIAKIFAGDVNQHQTASDFFEMMQA